MKAQIKGTLIPRHKGRSYKVITARHTEENWWTLECKDLRTKQNQVLKFQMLGMLEAMDAAARVTKDPKDILLVDLDNQGRWKIIPKDHVDRMERR